MAVAVAKAKASATSAVAPAMRLRWRASEAEMRGAMAPAPGNQPASRATPRCSAQPPRRTHSSPAPSHRHSGARKDS